MTQQPTDTAHDIRRTNITRFLSHLIVISMLFLLPEFILSYALPNHRGGESHQIMMYAKSVLFIIVFYIDYYFIIGHTLTPKVRIWRFLAYNLILLVAALALSYIMWHVIIYEPRMAENAVRPLRNPDKFRLMFASQLVRDGAMIILTISLAVALRLSDKWAAFERHTRDLADEQRATELRNLKSQINPHFLFNTLNSIYALIEISAPEAQRAVHELSQMLRYILYETPSKVSLRQEVDFTLNYISLMKLRLPEDVVKVDCDIDSMEQTPVAPLLFITLIENAFKHGNTGNSADKIDIAITARDGHIICRTRNRFDAHTVVDRQGGIGITNLRRRLLLIYDSNASLQTTVNGDVYTATLSININND